MASGSVAVRTDGEKVGDRAALDVSRDFCCFLCNGRLVVQGYVNLQPSFVRLCTSFGGVLEEFEYSSVYSVNEEEPPTTHSFIINLAHHSVYVCHLLRKELLVRVFQRLGVYKPDVRLPAESLGFPTGGLTGDSSCAPHAVHLVRPRSSRHVCHRCGRTHEHLQMYRTDMPTGGLDHHSRDSATGYSGRWQEEGQRSVPVGQLPQNTPTALNGHISATGHSNHTP